MADKNSYLKMIPNLTVREALRKLLNSGAAVTLAVTGAITGNVTGDVTGDVG